MRIKIFVTSESTSAIPALARDWCCHAIFCVFQIHLMADVLSSSSEIVFRQMAQNLGDVKKIIALSPHWWQQKVVIHANPYTENWMSLTSDAIRYQCYPILVSVQYIFIFIWSVVCDVTDFPRNSLPMLPCNCIIYIYIWSVVFVCGICGLHHSRVPKFLILVNCRSQQI